MTAMSNSNAPGLKLVVFDWAGTLIDQGSVAPVQAMVAMFENIGVAVTTQQVRSAMGLRKREHIECVLRIPEVLRAFQAARGRTPDNADVDALYAAYVPAQLEAIRRRGELIDGAAASVTYLREREIRVATNTGYFRAAAELVLECAKQQGFVPDYAVCADDVASGRPAPDMILACMKALRVEHPRHVLVVGDTAVDVLAGRNAGCWSVGVAGTGNEVGLNGKEWDQLELRERNRLLAHAHRTLRDAGADFVIDTLNDLPLVVERVVERGIVPAA
jgi:phosphonoacetaldehyde hydrolase